MYEAEDGTIHWTLSFYIPFSRLSEDGLDEDNVPPLPQPFDAKGRLADLDGHESAATRAMREAIDPLFNDIADRTRQGKVLDRLLVNGERENIGFIMPPHVSWKTEGKRFRVPIPQTDRDRSAEMRRFWYLHSNGAMSWHVAFAVRYRQQLADELAQYRVSTLYFLSLLQKLAWPKECDATQSDPDTLDIDNLVGMQIRTGEPARAAPAAFWVQLQEWFAQDRSTLDAVHEHAGGLGNATLLPKAPCIEVPGLQACETRSLFFIQDERFFNLIQPRTAAGVRVPRRERILDANFADYPERIKAIRARADALHVLDETFWHKQMAQDAPSAPADQAAGTLPLPDATERLLYLFLAGFNQNIIDWANQEASEVLDSLDPIYPSSEEHAEERFFVRYANPRSLITYVPKSRTLEVGNDHILTCPYAFLIHVLAMNNEHLTRETENRALQVIDWVDRRLEEAAGQIRAGAESKSLLETIDRQINGLRIDSFKHFDRHRYVNPFRYDTERNVFDELEKLRGTSRLQVAHKEALSALEEQAKDLERLRIAAEQRRDKLSDSREQNRDRRLGALFGLIGLSGLGQLLFNVRQFFSDKADAQETLDVWDWSLLLAQATIFVFILVGAIYLVLPSVRRLITGAAVPAD
jgi:hypothetical protein